MPLSQVNILVLTMLVSTCKENMLCWFGGGEVVTFKVLHQYSTAGFSHGIPEPQLAHLGCWESVLHCYLTVSCCCGLPGFLWKNCSGSSVHVCLVV